MAKRKVNFFQKFLDNKLRLKPYQEIGIYVLVFIISGSLGWLWEFFLGFAFSGFRDICVTGGNLLPWISLYAYGGVIILALTNRLRRYPWLVFVISALATGLLELFAGWAVYTVGNGTRYWDYSEVWWGFGSIDGFVCPVSTIVFGLGGLLLMYVLFPFCTNLAIKMKKKSFLTLVITLFVVIILDDIINLTLKNLGLPTAMDFYSSLGWKYK